MGRGMDEDKQTVEPSDYFILMLLLRGICKKVVSYQCNIHPI